MNALFRVLLWLRFMPQRSVPEDPRTVDRRVYRMRKKRACVKPKMASEAEVKQFIAARDKQRDEADKRWKQFLRERAYLKIIEDRQRKENSHGCFRSHN